MCYQIVVCLFDEEIWRFAPTRKVQTLSQCVISPFMKYNVCGHSLYLTYVCGLVNES